MRTVKQIEKEIADIRERGRKLNALQNEGGDGYDHTDHTQKGKLMAELKAARFAENWSREQTIEKRQAWNEEMRDLAKDGKITITEIAKTAKKLGYTMDDLKTAIAHHNL